MAGNQAIVDALYHATMVFFAMFFIAITIAFAVKIWRELEPGKRAEIKRRAPVIAGRGILGALKWAALIVFIAITIAFAVKIWRELEPGKRAEIKRRAPVIAGRGILGALKWAALIVLTLFWATFDLAFRENPDPHNRKL